MEVKVLVKRRRRFTFKVYPVNARNVKRNGEIDRERAVLPAIIWASEQKKYFGVYMIAVGWWAWGIHFVLTWMKFPEDDRFYEESKAK